MHIALLPLARVWDLVEYGGGCSAGPERHGRCERLISEEACQGGGVDGEGVEVLWPVGLLHWCCSGMHCIHSYCDVL